MSTEGVDVLLAEMAPVEPSPEVRARVLAGAVPEGRFLRFAERVAALLAIDVERAAVLLDRMQEAKGWLPLVPQAQLRPVLVGPNLKGCMATFVRVRAGESLIEHEHFGAERTLILQGTCLDCSDDRIYRAGDFITKPAASSHAVDAQPGPDLLLLSVVEHGVAMGAMILGRRP